MQQSVHKRLGYTTNYFFAQQTNYHRENENKTNGKQLL